MGGIPGCTPGYGAMSLEGLSAVASIGSSVANVTRNVAPLVQAGTRGAGGIVAGLEADAAQKRVQAEALKGRAQMLRIQGRRAILTGTLGALGAGVKGLTEYEKIRALQGKTAGGTTYSSLRAADFPGYGYD